MEVPPNVSLPLLGIALFTLLLSFIFCCYMWSLKRRARRERGYQRIKFSAKKKSPNDTCPVCLEEFYLKEKIVVCPCQHMFHSRCLLEWLQLKNSCPMCKAAVSMAPKNRVQIPVETTSLVTAGAQQHQNIARDDMV